MTPETHRLYDLDGTEQDVILILADISGYTRFVAANKTTLVHSHLIINELLDRIISGLEIPLRAAKLEGDAVFLYAIKDGPLSDDLAIRIGARIVQFFEAFRRRLEELTRGRICQCNACLNIERLRLKVLVHSGTALFSRIRDFDEVFGADVILLHRLLKNSVPADEYVLVTEAARPDVRLSEAEWESGEETYPELGVIRTYTWFPPADAQGQATAASTHPTGAGVAGAGPPGAPPVPDPRASAGGAPSDAPPVPEPRASASGPPSDAPHPPEPRAPASAPPAEPVRRSRPALDDVEQQIRRLSRRSLAWSAVAGVAGFAGWKWLVSRPDDAGALWPFRRVLEFNERLWTDYFSGRRLAPTFPLSRAKEPRANGMEGMPDAFDPGAWNLRVSGLASLPPSAETDDGALLLGMREIRALPKVEMVTELKCVEGWSEVVHWGGARFADFAAQYGPITRSGNPPNVREHPEDLVDYVSLMTPDGGYYVGLDKKSVLHPQTLLCYEMNGAPLTPEHGAPLRLVIPVKYGIKNLKRIGSIEFTDRRPADYWAERGYDYYAGH